VTRTPAVPMLCDVNVLLALVTDGHAAYAAGGHWFDGGSAGGATIFGAAPRDCSRTSTGIGGKVQLPEHVVIPEDKLVRYLLVPHEENDKCQFLGIAGYTVATWEILARDLHDLAKTHGISDMAISPYGIKWEVPGTLTGPNGQVLYVVTIWITLEASGETRFVTLFPDRERQP
jgi:hypothetical protein